MTTAVLEKQPVLFDPYSLTPFCPARCESIIDNIGVYCGYLTLYLLLTHKYPDEIINNTYKTAKSKMLDADLRRAMAVLNTSHDSIAGSPCYRISGLDGYDAHTVSHAQSKSNHDYIPKKYGVKGY